MYFKEAFLVLRE